MEQATCLYEETMRELDEVAAETMRELDEVAAAEAAAAAAAAKENHQDMQGFLFPAP